VSTVLPIEHFYDLSRLSDAGAEVAVAAHAEELQKLAQWLEVESVQKFEGAVTLTKLAAHRYRYDAVLVCDLTQSSVVSLDPVRSRIAERFSRELHVAHRARHAKIPEFEPPILDGGDDVAEELDSPHYDLAAPLLEELSLALDPYPKAPGEEFAAPEEPGARIENPFAVLKRLKDSG
jgi:uncharacterized metal-binding protein YceD (DUF177 family)